MNFIFLLNDINFFWKQKSDVTHNNSFPTIVLFATFVCLCCMLTTHHLNQ